MTDIHGALLHLRLGGTKVKLLLNTIIVDIVSKILLLLFVIILEWSVQTIPCYANRSCLIYFINYASEV